MAAAFITRAELGTKLGRDLATSDAATIAVDGASDVCRTVTEQTLTAVTGDTVRLDGTGTDALLLPEMPVTAVASVTVGDTAVDAADYVASDHGVLFRPGGTWTAGRQNVTVVYSHGYATADIPGDLRAVALAIAARLLQQGDVLYETNEAGGGVRFGVTATDLTAGERMILRKYKQAR